MSITDGSQALFGGDWHWRITEQTEHLKKLALCSLSSGLRSRAFPKNSSSYLKLQTANNSQQREEVMAGCATKAAWDTGGPLHSSPPLWIAWTQAPLILHHGWLQTSRTGIPHLYVLKNKKANILLWCCKIFSISIASFISQPTKGMCLCICSKFWCKSLDSINIESMCVAVIFLPLS